MKSHFDLIEITRGLKILFYQGPISYPNQNQVPYCQAKTWANAVLRNDPGPMMTFYDIKGREMENSNPTGFRGSCFSADV